MGANPSRFKGADRPVERVSFEDVGGFLSRVNETAPGLSLRLPSEAEWEYACRAGTRTAYAFGAEISKDQAQFKADETAPVASFAPNGWGIYDMHGNVREWCEDHWHGSYRTAPEDGAPEASSAARHGSQQVVVRLA